MSVSGVSSNLYNSNVQDQFEQFQQNFQQLGKDLTSGSLSAAQSDFATLEQDMTQLNSTSTSQNNSPIAQAFQQLSKDLQSGNLSGAQQAYSNIQQDFQSQASRMRHHHKSGGSQDNQQSQFAQLFDQLGQDLQSGDLSSAQTAFNSLQQFLQSNNQPATSGTSAASTFGNLSINA
jgi:CMP-N-acetylneuraminic acid synthetase